MSTISSVNNSNAYNPQITNKVAAANSANLANNAANESAFSSYIGQAFAQIGLANPTSVATPVISSASQANSSEKSLGSFIQDLFSILSQKNTQQTPTTLNRVESDFQQIHSQDNKDSESSSESEASAINEAAIAAYTSGNSTTVGNLASNLQSLVKQLNDESRNTENGSSGTIQALKNGFQSILDAQGAGSNSSVTLGNFLQTLAQNLQGESPLGIIVNTQA
jgi:hypothetical protein